MRWYVVVWRGWTIGATLRFCCRLGSARRSFGRKAANLARALQLHRSSSHCGELCHANVAGKTSLARRFAEGEFEGAYIASRSVQTFSAVREVGDLVYSIEVRVAASPQASIVHPGLGLAPVDLIGVNAILLVYRIDRPHTLEALGSILTHLDDALLGGPRPVLGLIGTHADAVTASAAPPSPGRRGASSSGSIVSSSSASSVPAFVTADDACAVGRSLGCQFVTAVSCRTGLSVSSAFYDTLRCVQRAEFGDLSVRLQSTDLTRPIATLSARGAVASLSAGLVAVAGAVASAVTSEGDRRSAGSGARRRAGDGAPLAGASRAARSTNGSSTNAAPGRHQESGSDSDADHDRDDDDDDDEADDVDGPGNDRRLDSRRNGKPNRANGRMGRHRDSPGKQRQDSPPARGLSASTRNPLKVGSAALRRDPFGYDDPGATSSSVDGAEKRPEAHRPGRSQFQQLMDGMIAAPATKSATPAARFADRQHIDDDDDDDDEDDDAAEIDASNRTGASRIHLAALRRRISRQREASAPGAGRGFCASACRRSRRCCRRSVVCCYGCSPCDAWRDSTCGWLVCLLCCFGVCCGGSLRGRRERGDGDGVLESGARGGASDGVYWARFWATPESPSCWWLIGNLFFPVATPMCEPADPFVSKHPWKRLRRARAAACWLLTCSCLCECCDDPDDYSRYRRSKGQRRTSSRCSCCQSKSATMEPSVGVGVGSLNARLLGPESGAGTRLSESRTDSSSISPPRASGPLFLDEGPVAPTAIQVLGASRVAPSLGRLAMLGASRSESGGRGSLRETQVGREIALSRALAGKGAPSGPLTAIHAARSETPDEEAPGAASSRGATARPQDWLRAVHEQGSARGIADMEEWLRTNRGPSDRQPVGSSAAAVGPELTSPPAEQPMQAPARDHDDDTATASSSSDYKGDEAAARRHALPAPSPLWDARLCAAQSVCAVVFLAVLLFAGAGGAAGIMVYLEVARPCSYGGQRATILEWALLAIYAFTAIIPPLLAVGAAGCRSHSALALARSLSIWLAIGGSVIAGIAMGHDDYLSPYECNDDDDDAYTDDTAGADDTSHRPPSPSPTPKPSWQITTAATAVQTSLLPRDMVIIAWSMHAIGCVVMALATAFIVPSLASARRLWGERRRSIDSGDDDAMWGRLDTGEGWEARQAGDDSHEEGSDDADRTYEEAIAGGATYGRRTREGVGKAIGRRLRSGRRRGDTGESHSTLDDAGPIDGDDIHEDEDGDTADGSYLTGGVMGGQPSANASHRSQRRGAGRDPSDGLDASREDEQDLRGGHYRSAAASSVYIAVQQPPAARGVPAPFVIHGGDDLGAGGDDEIMEGRLVQPVYW